MPTTSEFRKGLKIEMNGEPFIIAEFLHVKPGKGGAFVRTKLKSLLTGKILEHTFRAGERVESPDIEEKEVQYLYHDGENYYFMDKESYWQFELTEDQLGNSKDFLNGTGRPRGYGRWRNKTGEIGNGGSGSGAVIP
jgi:elongation factor P